MRRRTFLFVCFGGLIAQAGCSQSAPPAEPIKDLPPGEYRDQAEQARKIPATAPKAGGKKRP